MSTCVGLLVGVLLAYTTSLAQVQQAWVQRYNGPGDYYDLVSGLAADAQGNVYVTGSSYPAGSQNNQDYLTLKYSPAGAVLWERRYSINDSDRPSDIAVDASGNVYVAGSAGLVKYNSSGAFQWTRTDAGPVIALRGTDVYLAGSAFGDAAIWKYDSAGNLIWFRTYAGPLGESDVATSLILDSFGNPFISGYVNMRHDATTSDFFVAMYDAAGNRQWASTYNGTANRMDLARDLALDPGGNPVVTGWANVQSQFFEGDFATVKFDRNGNRLWAVEAGGVQNGTDRPAGVEVDASGNVFVAGTSDGKGTEADYLTIKYDANGNQQWQRRYDWTQRYNSLSDLGLDSSGNIYVTGGGFTAESNSTDYGTIKYDTAGNVIWVQVYDGPDNSLDDALHMVVGSSGAVYVTGESYGNTSQSDYATVKYSQAMQVLPTSFTVTRGVLQSGGLAELLQSDDARLVIQQRPPFSAADPSAQLIVEGTAPSDFATSLSFILEANSSGLPSSNVLQRVELFNYQTNLWELVDERPPTTSDSVVQVDITSNAGRFIQPATRLVKARMGWFDRGTLSPNWLARIDQTVWTVFP